MLINRIRIILTIMIFTLLWLSPAQSSNRWEVLKWCTENTQADISRCNGFLYAALDLSVSDDFSGPRSCFYPSTHLSDVRVAVIEWLKDNKTASEKSGLALVARAIHERFPCPK